jgi:hypothetical protein
MFIIEQEGGPLGWIPWYLWSCYPQHAGQLGVEPASSGIDLAIGEPSMTGLGLGPTAIREFLRQVVFSNPETRGVVSDAAESNLRSLRAFEKAGFKVVRTVRITGERRWRHVVRLDRPDKRVRVSSRPLHELGPFSHIAVRFPGPAPRKHKYRALKRRLQGVRQRGLDAFGANRKVAACFFTASSGWGLGPRF